MEKIGGIFGKLRLFFLETAAWIFVFGFNVFLYAFISHYLRTNQFLSNTLCDVKGQLIHDIPVDTIIGLIAVLLAFASIVGFLVYKLISTDIMNEVKRHAKNESIMLRATTYKTIAYIHHHTFHTIYEKTKEVTNENINNLNPDALKELETTIEFVSLALTFLDDIENQNIDKTEYERIYCLSRNNLAYYLYQKWHYIRGNRNEDEFKKFLKDNESDKKYNYDKDKETALELVKYLKKSNCVLKFSAYAHHYIDTFKKVEEFFL
jgi:RecA-family ATPase